LRIPVVLRMSSFVSRLRVMMGLLVSLAPV
jgi:hypothetical protein